jgi:hypothetical protein
MSKVNRFSAIGLVVCAALVVGGCKEDKSTNKQGGGTPSATGAAGGGTQKDHPNAVTLGETTSNGLKFKATQDEPIKAGGEGAFDLLITGYPAGGKPKAVRFWVGVESGQGSVKAKAEEESADNWHTHVEVPNPLPAGSKFWAQVDPASGAAFKVSFDLK